MLNSHMSFDFVITARMGGKKEWHTYFLLILNFFQDYTYEARLWVPGNVLTCKIHQGNMTKVKRELGNLESFQGTFPCTDSQVFCISRLV